MQLITDLILFGPGILNIIPHLEFGLGAYLPKGGMHEITNSLVKLAKEIELNFILIKKLLPLKQKKLGKECNNHIG
jgi:hypothetical protein